MSGNVATTSVGGLTWIISYDFVPDVLNYTHINSWEKIKDDDSFGMACEVIRKEGLLVGGSCGAALTGAIQFLKTPEGFEKFGNVEGKNVVVVFPDR